MGEQYELTIAGCPRPWKDFLYFNVYFSFDQFLLDIGNLKERKKPWKGLSPNNPRDSDKN